MIKFKSHNCPSCEHPQRLKAIMHRSAWSNLQCLKCGEKLRFNIPKESIKESLHFVHFAVMISLIAVFDWWWIMFVLYLAFFIPYFIFAIVVIEIDTRKKMINP
jgi:hypothetical protein